MTLNYTLHKKSSYPNFGHSECEQSLINVDTSSCTAFMISQIPVLIQTSDEEAYLTDFNKHFPVFSLIGTKRCISSTAVEYDAQSEDTMLVCKYLKAKEINKLDKLHKGWFYIYY